VTVPTLYHGTAEAFAPGDTVDPSYELGARRGRAFVYATTDPDVARNYARHKAWVKGMFEEDVRARTYEVRPTGPVEPDDTVDGRFAAWRTRRPMEVVRELP
jgi:hypothetical protein